jgi:hypothetical protein
VKVVPDQTRIQNPERVALDQALIRTAAPTPRPVQMKERMDQILLKNQVVGLGEEMVENTRKIA